MGKLPKTFHIVFFQVSGLLSTVSIYTFIYFSLVYQVSNRYVKTQTLRYQARVVSGNASRVFVASVERLDLEFGARSSDTGFPEDEPQAKFLGIVVLYMHQFIMSVVIVSLSANY